MEDFLAAFPFLLLIFVRITSFFLIAPLFAMKGVPSHFKLGLGALLALITWSGASFGETIPLDGYFIGMAIREVMIGIALGFIAALILYTVQVAGAFIDFQMGFAIASVIDPQTGSQVPIIGHFKYIFALLFLLSVNGHHMLLDGIMRSLQVLPVGTLTFAGSSELGRFILDLFTGMFLSALQIALPIIGALFLTDVALGILAKTVPQLNIFAVGFPLKIFTGFVLLMFSMPIFFYILQTLFEEMMVSMGELTRLLGGS